MPNFKLTDGVRSDLRDHCTMLSRRVVEYIEADFPLTVNEVQTIVLEPNQIARLKQLRDAEGIQTIEKHDHIRVAFLRAVTPGIHRGLVCEIRLPVSIFVGRSTQYGLRSSTKFELDESHYLVPILANRLGQDRIDAVAHWIEKVVQQRRLHQAVIHTLRKVINERHMPTTGHMHAGWPAMIPYLIASSDSDRKTRMDQKTGKYVPMRNWRDKLDAPPRSLKNYRPGPGFVMDYGKLMTLTDMVLLQGDMLKPYEAPRNAVRATGEVWETLTNDKVYP